MNKVSVVGLGKRGACMVACFAHRGFSVVGVDIEQKNVDAINQGLPPVFEPHLAEMISESRDRIIATTSMRDSLNQHGKSQKTFSPGPKEREPTFQDISLV